MFLDTFTHSFCHPEQTGDSIEEGDVSDPNPPSTASHSLPTSPGSRVLLLRDGSSSTTQSLCSPSFGSRAVLRHFLVHCLWSTSIERVVLISLLFPHSHYAYLTSSDSDSQQRAKQKLTVIDAVSDLAFPTTSVASDSSTSASVVQPASQSNPAYHSHFTCSSLSDLSALQTAVEKLSVLDRLHTVVVIDGLSTLLLYHSPPSLLRWLLSLRALSNVSLLIHADYACHDAVSDSTWTAALSRLAGSRITTTAVRQEKVVQSTASFQPQPAAAATGTAIHTTITAHISHTRASGRTATKQEHYLLQPTSLTLTAASQTAPTASAQSAADDITSTLTSLMVDDSAAAAAERRRQAKAAVVLPYAHQGEMRVGYGVGGLEMRRVDDEVGMDADDELLDDEDDDVDDDLDI